MKSVKTYNIRDIIIEGLLYAYLIAILYSKTLLTIVMGTIFLLAFIDISYKNGFSISLKKDIKSSIFSFFHSKQYTAITLVFFLVVLSGFNSGNLQEWKHHLVLKLPFVLLPFAFFMTLRISTKQYYRLYTYFVILMSLSVLPVLFQYFVHKHDIDQLIKTGQIIQTPIDHIRYSLLLAFSVAASLLLYVSDYFEENRNRKIMVLFTGIINFVALHILAVRSGLVIGYILILFLIIKCIWNIKKRYLLFLLLSVIVFPLLSYQFIDSFRNKIEYMRYDYSMYLQDRGHNYSDSERIYSWKIGLGIFKKNILAGTGIGDLKEECITAYKNKDMSFKYPHNQFLFILASSGTMGLILFLVAIYYPLLNSKTRSDPFFLSFMILITISFFVENSIERSYSVGMYLFFVLIAINHSLSNSKKTDDNNYICANFKNSVEQK